MTTEMTKTGKKNLSRVRTLMRECAVNRRQWIIDEEPAVAEVIEEFPAFQNATLVRMCVCVCVCINNCVKNVTFNITAA